MPSPNLRVGIQDSGKESLGEQWSLCPAKVPVLTCSHLPFAGHGQDRGTCGLGSRRKKAETPHQDSWCKLAPFCN